MDDGQSCPPSGGAHHAPREVPAGRRKKAVPAGPDTYGAGPDSNPDPDNRIDCG